ncbi:MAG: PQQ-binding-like beta-propeller repeat protein, partial [Planctomycetaceae bacterium]
MTHIRFPAIDCPHAAAAAPANSGRRASIRSWGTRTGWVTACLVLGLLPTWPHRARGDDWPAFRGPRGDGISTETAAPLEWSTDKNILWKTALPAPGNGSPIVARDRVWVAGPGTDPHDRSLHCFER